MIGIRLFILATVAWTLLMPAKLQGKIFQLVKLYHLCLITFNHEFINILVFWKVNLIIFANLFAFLPLFERLF